MMFKWKPMRREIWLTDRKPIPSRSQFHLWNQLKLQLLTSTLMMNLALWWASMESSELDCRAAIRPVSGVRSARALTMCAITHKFLFRAHILTTTSHAHSHTNTPQHTQCGCKIWYIVAHNNIRTSTQVEVWGRPDCNCCRRWNNSVVKQTLN